MASINNSEFKQKELLKRVGNLSQIMGAQKYICDDGAGKGTSVIRVRNGKGLDFNIIPDKALDILDINYKSTPLAWIAKPGLVDNKFFDDKGFGWLRSFGGGMMTTCGMRNAGPPVDDNGEHYGLHGRATSIPAKNVNCKEYWKNNDFYIEVSGVIREARTFGENLVINRTIFVSSRNNDILITDKVVNEGFSTEDIMLIYHLNWGFPLLSKESELKINNKKTWLRDEMPGEEEQWNTFTDPVKDISEVVYFHDLEEDKNNRIKYELSNPKLGIGIAVEWNKDELPYLIEWKMMGEGEYVLGLEPSNNLASGRVGERESGRIQSIKSFEEKTIQIKISVNEL